MVQFHRCLCDPGKAVTVNGMPVTLPKVYSGSGLTLEHVGLFVSLSSRLGVTLLWDGGTTHTHCSRFIPKTANFSTERWTKVDLSSNLIVEHAHVCVCA